MKKAVDSIIEIPPHSFNKRVEIKSITKAIPRFISWEIILCLSRPQAETKLSFSFRVYKSDKQT